jgi:hypothetical protein
MNFKTFAALAACTIVPFAGQAAAATLLGDTVTVEFRAFDDSTVEDRRPSWWMERRR